jgi:ADP-heptose:LPS heptosyltransferase
MRSKQRREYGTIGIMRFGAMGDIVLTFPVVTSIRQRYAANSIIYITKKKYGELVSLHPCVDDIMVVDTEGEHASLKGIREWCRTVRGRIDTLVDLHGTPRSRIISILLKSGRVVRYRKHHIERSFLTTRFRNLSLYRSHTTDLYGQVQQRLDGSNSKRHFSSFYTISKEKDAHGSELLHRHSTGDTSGTLSGTLCDEAAAFLAQHGLSKDDIIVGISPGAAWKTKRWDTDRFVDVIEMLLARKAYHIVIILSGQENNLDMRIGGAEELHVLRTDSYRELAAAISCMSVLLCNDSGPLHLAEALNVPVLALYGPTHPLLGFSPRHPDSIALYGRSTCSPCSLHGKKKCRYRLRECFLRIEPQEVAERLVNMLKRVSE